MEMDYRVNKLTTMDFEKQSIYISEEQLKYLKSRVSSIIREFYFQNPFTSPYTSRETQYGTEISTKFLLAKYKVMRYLYFCVSDHLGHPARFKEINDIETQYGGGKGSLTHYFSRGQNFGYTKLLYLQNILDNIGQSWYKSYANLAIQDYRTEVTIARASPIGIAIHCFIQLKILDFLIEEKGFMKKVTYEKSNKEGYVMDIIINEKTIKYFGQIDNKFSKIVIELTMASNDKTIELKTKKHYQTDNRFLLIVLYHRKNEATIERLNNKYAGDKDNVKIISFDELLDILEFDSKSKGEIIKKMNDYIDNAFGKDKDFDNLVALGEKWEALLDAKYSHTKANFLG